MCIYSKNVVAFLKKKYVMTKIIRIIALTSYLNYHIIL